MAHILEKGRQSNSVRTAPIPLFAFRPELRSLAKGFYDKPSTSGSGARKALMERPLLPTGGQTASPHFCPAD